MYFKEVFIVEASYKAVKGTASYSYPFLDFSINAMLKLNLVNFWGCKNIPETSLKLAVTCKLIVAL